MIAQLLQFARFILVEFRIAVVDHQMTVDLLHTVAVHLLHTAAAAVPHTVAAVH